MNSTLINPEVLDLETSVLEESPMTETEEKELVLVTTTISTAFGDKTDRDLAIGAGLLRIFRRKLYRGKDGGRSWEAWLAAESAELTSGRGPLGKDTAHRLRGFYQFRVEVLGSMAPGPCNLPLPTSPKQIRPLLGQLDTHKQAAIAMWKAACTTAGKGAVPTHDQVQRAYHVHISNKQNEARRLSAAEQERMQKATAASQIASRAEPEVVTDYSPEPQQVTNSIPAWELQKDDSSIDAGAECKRITQALNEAHKSIGLLRGILYSQINTYGRDYLGFLRQVDAGVYSLHNIDDQVQQMGEDIDFISSLLIADVGEGDLAASTVEVSSFPARS